ncbi:MAG TPA: hypothetical protein VGM98_16100 [Schlesneria sp.]|jgi:hypothetical protein
MLHSRRNYVLGSLAILALAMSGCGSAEEGPAKYKVSGTVTFNGENVNDGLITFTPVEGGKGPEAGPIKDGKYSLQAKGGKQQVSITAAREVPGKTESDYKGGFVPVKEAYIPEKYNEKTELSVEVKKGGGEHDFKLTD